MVIEFIDIFPNGIVAVAAPVIMILIILILIFEFYKKFFNNSNYKILSKRNITDNAFELTIKCNQTIKSCEHIAIHFKDSFRKYTPINYQNNIITLRIKKYNGGVISNYLYNLNPNDFVKLSITGQKYLADSKTFINNTNKLYIPDYNHIILIASGSGITPIYSLLKQIVNNNYKITVITCDKYIKDEMCPEINLFNKIERIRCLSQENTNIIDKIPGRIFFSRLTKNVFKSILPSPHIKNAVVFICGSPSFSQSTQKMCKELLQNPTVVIF